MAITERAPAGRSPQTVGTRGGVQKMGGASGLADVLAVILEKGIVVDAWVRLSIIGIEILTLEVRAVIASVDTYLRYAEAIGLTSLAAAPRTATEPLALPPDLLGGGGGGNGNGAARVPALPGVTPGIGGAGIGGPTTDEILAYLEAHPDGVRLNELQSYFGTERSKLESILSKLVQEALALLDVTRGVYRPGNILSPAIP